MKLAVSFSVVGSILSCATTVHAESSSPASGVSSSSKRGVLPKVEERDAYMGVSAVVRGLGPVPASASIGVRWFERQYLLFAPWIGFQLDAQILFPAYTEYLYGFRIGSFDTGFAARACFSPGFMDVCPGVGATAATFQVGEGPSRSLGSAFASLHSDVTLTIVPALSMVVGAEAGYYFQRFAITIDENPNQRWEAPGGFFLFSVGMAQRIKDQGAR